MMNKMIQHTSGVSASELPEDVHNFAQAIAARHGHVIVSREKNGLHLNVACPSCLSVDGNVELRKRHLAINADKWLGTGKWQEATEKLRNSVALCMKCGTKYLATQLMQWAKLEDRGIKESVVGSVSFVDNTHWLVRDQNNNIIPGGPGNGGPEDVIPINQLPPTHPAAWYLLNRGYDLDSLYRQFRTSYCVREWAHDPAAKRFYKTMGSFRDSPQGRIIFFSDQEGVQVSWQARIIDHTYEHEGVQYKTFWNGYTNEWMTMEYFDVTRGKFVALPQFPKWDPSKYRTANGTSRNEVVMGLDAAIRYNAEMRPGAMPLAFTSEGPLDAGRLRAPALAQIGKFLSDAQVEIMAKHFTTIIQVPDLDTAGQANVESNSKRLGAKVMTDVWAIPAVQINGKKTKDIGDFPQAFVDDNVRQYLLQY